MNSKNEEANKFNKDNGKKKNEIAEKKNVSIPGYITTDCNTYEKLKPFSLENRKKSTRAESILWEALRNRKIGCKFRRQHIIGTFIVDFVCLSEKLTVEVDGDIHNDPERIKKDLDRTNCLISLSYSEIRFTNEMVIDNLSKVLEEIKNYISSKKNSTK